MERLLVLAADLRKKMYCKFNFELGILDSCSIQVDRYHSSELLHNETELWKLKHRWEQHILQFMFIGI